MKNKESILGFNDEDDIHRKNNWMVCTRQLSGIFVIINLLAVILITACNKEQISPRTAPSGQTKSLTALPPAPVLPPVTGDYYMQVNLVADAKSFDARHLDVNLENAWGMALGEGGIWITSNRKGLAAVYNGEGETVRPPVDIPFHGINFASAPNGVVYNSTGGFLIPSTMEKSKFIFSTGNGTIAAWNSGRTAVTVADRSSTGAVYKGIAIAADRPTPLLFATNFSSGKIEMFDQSFRYTGSFTDPGIPADFAPFNIKLMDGKLYVTYARQNADRRGAEAGMGNGYVSIFNTDGSFVSRFASQGTLNSPWGMAEMEGPDGNKKILIGNFGDGHISIFDAAGKFEGMLMGARDPITIQGLRDIAFLPGTTAVGSTPLSPAIAAAPDNSHLYFTAGPDDETQGLFGYLQHLQTVQPVADSIRPGPIAPVVGKR